MKILYVAKHNSGGNDDEGAIAHALEVLGHSVTRIQEAEGGTAWKQDKGHDFALVHHWRDTGAIKRIRIPKAFWCFDLIDYPDPTIEPRNKMRRQWANEMTLSVDRGFMSDGDWVAKDKTGKLRWMMQGADERIVAEEPGIGIGIRILFTGSGRGGVGRDSFIADMKERWGDAFRHIERGVYREQLANLIAASEVVVCPDHPATNRYWSNRVYNAAGFGGFVVHPACAGLMEQYPPLSMRWYENRHYLNEIISAALNIGRTERFAVAEQALEWTKQHHLYRHRCEMLVAVMRGL